MKNYILITFALLLAVFSISTVNGQVDNVKLNQIPGAFETEAVTLAPGDYQFEIGNNGVDHEVGFVLVPKGKYDQPNHISAAYVKETVANGKTSLTSVVTLAAGAYEYFCPMNPTPKYSLTVTNDIKNVKLTQVPGEFKEEKLKLKAGLYQFEIANDGVDHEVGFVLVPKGKYDPSNHITEAYVKSVVPTDSSSKTSVVKLEAGEYEYFCPMNPTPKYTLVVK